MKITVPTFFLLLLTFPLLSQTPEVLGGYIREALGSNIALQRQELSYDASLAAMKEARAMFLPKVFLDARYSVARGGRAIIIPVGDLVNPVYQNLNVLNQLGSDLYPDYPTIPEYPMISNVQENFLREQEHETKVRMVMPVFNAAIIRNHQIRQSMSEAEKTSVDIYRRELVKEVKTAYFNYLKAYRAVQLFENTLVLVQENERTTRSLYDNHQVTLDVVYSAVAEVAEVEQELAGSRRDEKSAQAYFNFLLNRPYDTPVEVLPETDLPAAAVSVEQARTLAFRQREEFRQLSYYLTASDQKIKLDKDNYLPQLNLVADYGFQGTEYSFTGEDDFIQGSLVLNWNLFDGTTRHRVQQARIEREELTRRKEETRQQIGLQVVNSFYDLEAAAARIEAARAEAEAASRAFRLVQKKFAQGQANLVEFTKARTQLTNAEQKLNIARYDYQVRLAEFERVTAGYSF